MMSQNSPGSFSRRVSEQQVANILNLIHSARNNRSQPLPDDLEGDFDAWFDGGAIKWVTGTTQYSFRNGATAHVSVTPVLVVSVYFPDGRRVSIAQDEARTPK